MKPIEEAFLELKRAISLLDLFDLFYNTTFAFLFSFFLFMLAHINWQWAFLPSIFFFLFYGWFKFKQNKFLRTEQTTPDLAEKLRTAADNLDKENQINQELQEEVIRDLRKVETVKFLDFKELSIKTTLLFTLALLILVVSYLDVGFDLPQLSQKIQEPVQSLKERISGQDVPSVDRKISEGNLSSVLGNKSLALLGKKEVVLQLNPLQSEADFENVGDTSQKDFNPPEYPKEIYTSYDIASNERLEAQNSKVIKSYFQEISR